MQVQGFNSDAWFTVEQLAEMGLRGYPRTGRNWHNRAKAEGWKSREVESAGRKGMRTEYSPPPEIMPLIEQRQRQIALDLFRSEFKKFTDAAPPEPFSESSANFVDLYNNYGEDFFNFPNWLRKRIPKLELQEFQSWVTNKPHGFEDDYMRGTTSITSPFHPSLAEKIGAALFEVYGAEGYGALDEKIKIGVYGALYSAFCQIGASETAVPSIEEVKTVIKLAIKYGKAPAPANADN